MLERTEKYFLQGRDPEPRIAAATRSMIAQGFDASLKPGVGAVGTSPDLGHGLHLEASVVFGTAGAGVTMDVVVEGRVSTSRKVMIALATLLLFPVGILLVMLTYRRFDSETPAFLEELHTSVQAVNSIMPKPSRQTSHVRFRTPYIERGDSMHPSKKRRSG